MQTHLINKISSKSDDNQLSHFGLIRQCLFNRKELIFRKYLLEILHPVFFLEIVPEINHKIAHQRIHKVVPKFSLKLSKIVYQIVIKIVPENVSR